MARPLRVFIAVPIPGVLAAFLQHIQRQLRSAEMDVRWLAVQNIHLTLKFLGDVDPPRVSEVAARMDAAVGQIPPFRLRARGVGVFPNRRHARVLWVGLDGELDPLDKTQAALESGLASIGFGRETRRFHPHLTIGRTRRRIDVPTIDAALGLLKDAASDSFQVDRMGLFKSDLKPAGAEYTLLHSSPLAV